MYVLRCSTLSPGYFAATASDICVFSDFPVFTSAESLFGSCAVTQLSQHPEANRPASEQSFSTLTSFLTHSSSVCFEALSLQIQTDSPKLRANKYTGKINQTLASRGSGSPRCARASPLLRSCGSGSPPSVPPSAARPGRVSTIEKIEGPFVLGESTPFFKW